MADKVINPSDKEVLVDCRNAQFPIMHNTLWYVDTVEVSSNSSFYSVELRGAKSLLFCSVIAYTESGYTAAIDNLKWAFDTGSSVLTVGTGTGMFGDLNIIKLSIFAIAKV